MKPDDNYDSEIPSGSIDSDEVLKEESDEAADLNDLNYNEEAGSYELDVKETDPVYDHPDPYDSAAPNGEDDNSDWDSANPYVGDEYAKKASLETDADKLGMHIATEENVRVDPIDEELAKTPEDDRDDLDAEGYPKNI